MSSGSLLCDNGWDMEPTALWRYLPPARITATSLPTPEPALDTGMMRSTHPTSQFHPLSGTWHPRLTLVARRWEVQAGADKRRKSPRRLVLAVSPVQSFSAQCLCDWGFSSSSFFFFLTELEDELLRISRARTGFRERILVWRTIRRLRPDETKRRIFDLSAVALSGLSVTEIAYTYPIQLSPCRAILTVPTRREEKADSPNSCKAKATTPEIHS